MKFAGYSGALVALVFVWSGPAFAENELETAPGAQPYIPAPQTPIKPRVSAPRTNGFAAGAAKNTTRMSSEQKIERGFLREAAASNRFQLETGRMALVKSRDATVRRVASERVEFHTAASNELLHLLHARSMASPLMDNERSKVLARLAKSTGPQFDRDYLETVGVRAYQHDLRYYEKALVGLSDSPIEKWIERKLPSMRYQLASAERAQPGHRLAKNPVDSPPVRAAPASARSMVQPGAAPAARVMPKSVAAQPADGAPVPVKKASSL